MVVPWYVIDDEELAATLVSWGLPAVVGEVVNDIQIVMPGACDERVQVGEAGATFGETSVVMRNRVRGLSCYTVPEHLRLIGVRPAGDKMEVTGVVDLIEDAHTHFQLGATDPPLVIGEPPPFPVPLNPGLALHHEPGYGVTWERVTEVVTVASDPAPANALSLRRWPNPFASGTSIAFDLPAVDAISLRVFDAAGRHVRTLVEGRVFESGRHRVAWDGRDGSGRRVGSGVYFCRLESRHGERIRSVTRVASR